jgi:large subunit ribosomal protein L10
MSKAVKALQTGELKSRYSGISSACLVDLTGMDVQAQEKLRRTLRKKSARVEVMRNSIARQAFRGSALSPLAEVMQGPCALVTTSESAPEIGKLLMEVAKEFTQLKLKQAIFDGDPSLLSVEALARIKGRVELLGELAMLLMSPARALAGCLKSPQGKLAGCLKAIADKGESEAAAA